MNNIKIINTISEVYNTFSKMGWHDEGEKNYFSNQKNRYYKIIEYILQIKAAEKNKLLDVGTHMLHFSTVAKELSYDVYGSDIEQFVNDDINKLRIQHYGLREPKICQLENYFIPFDNNSFDIIVFAETIEHLNFNPLPILKEFYRLLKHDGILVISTPNVLRIGNRIKLLFGKTIYTSIEEHCYGDPVGIHRKEYSSTELEKLLAWAKFTLVLSECKFIYPKRYYLYLIERFIQILFPSMAGTLFVIGQKKI